MQTRGFAVHELGNLIEGSPQDVAAFTRQTEALYTDTDFQLIGSVGRQAIMASYSCAVPALFLRHSDGTLRDIDIAGTTSAAEQPLPASVLSPHPIDSQSQWLRRTANGWWLTFPRDPSIAEELHPDVLKPVVRRIGDFMCRTYAATTQAYLNTMVGFQRPKDKTATAAYARFLISLDPTDVYPGDAPLPERAYQPFDKFATAIRTNYPAYVWACRAGVAYHLLPSRLQASLRRTILPIKRHYLGKP